MPFGVVLNLNEAMGDEVKMTVIATGFERQGLPTPSAIRLPTFATRLRRRSL